MIYNKVNQPDILFANALKMTRNKQGQRAIASNIRTLEKPNITVNYSLTMIIFQNPSYLRR